MKVLRSQFVVEQRIFWRNWSGVFFTFILPIALLVSFSFANDPIDFIAFFAALSIISTGFQGLAIQLSMHREQGVLKRLMASPLSASTLVGAKALSIFVVTLIELVIIVAFSVAAYDAPVPADPALLLLVTLVGTVVFVALGFALASVIPSSDAAPAAANAAYFALVLVTVAFAAVDSIPDGVRTVGEQLPLGLLLELVDRTWFDDGGSILVPLLVLLAWGVAGAAWTVQRFRWEPTHER